MVWISVEQCLFVGVFWFCFSWKVPFSYCFNNAALSCTCTLHINQVEKAVVLAAQSQTVGIPFISDCQPYLCGPTQYLYGGLWRRPPYRSVLRATLKKESISAIICCSLEFLTGSCQQIWVGTTPKHSCKVQGDSWEVVYWWSSIAYPCTPVQKETSHRSKLLFDMQKGPPGQLPTLQSEESSASLVVSSVLLSNQLTGRKWEVSAEGQTKQTEASVSLQAEGKHSKGKGVGGWNTVHIAWLGPGYL